MGREWIETSHECCHVRSFSSQSDMDSIFFHSLSSPNMTRLKSPLLASKRICEPCLESILSNIRQSFGINSTQWPYNGERCPENYPLLSLHRLFDPFPFSCTFMFNWSQIKKYDNVATGNYERRYASGPHQTLG